MADEGRFADFAPGDPPRLVDDAFSCPTCGGQPGIPHIAPPGRPWGWESTVHCRCASCGNLWTRELSLGQVLHLMRPPAAYPPDPFASLPQRVRLAWCS